MAVEVAEGLGLPVGSEAPNFGLEDLRGKTLTLDSVSSSGKPVMLLFTDPGCGPCNALLPEVSRWQEQHQEKLTVALISRGDGEENGAKAHWAMTILRCCSVFRSCRGLLRLPVV